MRKPSGLQVTPSDLNAVLSLVPMVLHYSLDFIHLTDVTARKVQKDRVVLYLDLLQTRGYIENLRIPSGEVRWDGSVTYDLTHMLCKLRARVVRAARLTTALSGHRYSYLDQINGIALMMALIILEDAADTQTEKDALEVSNLAAVIFVILYQGDRHHLWCGARVQMKAPPLSHLM